MKVNKHIPTFISVLMSMVLIWGLLYNSIVLASFKLQQETLAQTECVQKDVKNNCCKASCVLTKSMQDSPENESNTPSKRMQEFLSVWVVLPQKSFNGLGNTATEKQLISTTIGKINLGFLCSPFIPPIV